jgi:hypothetical protein
MRKASRRYTPRMSGDLLERLSNKFTVGDACWVWHAAKSVGYGKLNWHGKQQFAHRLTYELMVGPIPAGLELDHLCRNRACVRPDHLEPVSRRENLRRGDTFVAQYLSHTHCKEGHPLSGDNLVMDGRARRCRICRNLYARQRSRRHA